MKRQARCWICGGLFEAERGSLAPGARFVCEPCVADGLRGEDGADPDHETLARVLYDRHGVPYVDLDGLVVPDEVLSLVPEEFARHNAVLPLMFLRPKAPGQGKQTGVQQASRSALDEALEARSGAVDPSAGEAPGPRPPPVALVVAVADPANEFALESLKRTTGLPIRCCVSTWAELVETIDDVYLHIALAEGPSDGS